MKIVVLHGQNHKGSTWHITQLLLDELKEKKDNVSEFQINGIEPCVGCFTCITKDEALCPHRSLTGPIVKAIEEADVVIVDSPNYCMGMTGQLKTFFDHLGYRWMSHRPHSSMKSKIGVAISTTAGMGAVGVTKDIKKQLFWWGIPKIYRLPFTVSAASWSEVKEEKRKKITHTIEKTAQKIKKSVGKVKPGIKSKFIFSMMRGQQKGMAWNPVDKKHWEENGWL